jgi:hypothetical protein
MYQDVENVTYLMTPGSGELGGDTSSLSYIFSGMVYEFGGPASALIGDGSE